MNTSSSCLRIFYGVVCGVAILLITAHYRPLTAATPAPATPKVAGQTKPVAASGELVLYTAWDESDINAVMAGFNKVYPNVKVSAIRSEGGRGAMLERMLTEIDAGKPMADVYNTGIPDMTAMLQRKEILSYPSPRDSTDAA